MNFDNHREDPSPVYGKEAQEFLRQHMDQDKFDIIMNSRQGKELPYVAARIFLNDEDWERYLWIGKHGSLDGF